MKHLTDEEIRRLPSWKQELLNDETVSQEIKDNILRTAEKYMDIKIPEELAGYEGKNGDRIMPEEEKQEHIKHLKQMRDYCKFFLDLTGTKYDD